MYSLVMKLMFKVALFKPVIYQLPVRTPILLHLAYLPPSFFLLSHLPSVLGSTPTISSSEHPDSTLDFLTACVLVCLTCKPLRCLISYFGFQSAKHVDMLSAHLGVFICLSPYVIALFLFILLPLSPVSS